jgi:hypothetical protein
MTPPLVSGDKEWSLDKGRGVKQEQEGGREGVKQEQEYFVPKMDGGYPPLLEVHPGLG